MIGRVHSIQSMGTLDGPGVRFVIFLQGCPLRCKCCHNPATWDFGGGTAYTAEELVTRALRFREYFGEQGGVTVSGGEPLCQAQFVRELFERCHEAGLNTCMDTAGILLSDEVEAILDVTDRVLLDIKYTDERHYRETVGCEMATPLAFLDRLQEKGIATTLRQVIIPTQSDDEENIRRFAAIARAHSVVDKIELLPFRKLCTVKYDSLGIPFRFADIPEPTRETMARLESLLKQ